MKTIIARVDDKVADELDQLAKGTTRSELVREAIREYVAHRRIEERRRQVEEYMRTTDEHEWMRELAESDMDHAAELLEREEHER